MSDFERCLRKIEELQPYHEYLCARGGDLAAFNPYEVLNRERMRVRGWLARRKVWTCIHYLAEHLMQRECLHENEILWICSGVPNLDNPDQQCLFVGSSGRKCYETPTRDHFLVREGAAVCVKPEKSRALRYAERGLDEKVVRVAA